MEKCMHKMGKRKRKKTTGGENIDEKQQDVDLLKMRQNRKM